MSELGTGPLLERPAFAVGERTFSWREVLAAARAWGAWGECEQAVRDARARQAHAERHGRAPSDEELRQRERAFRRERGLLSGEELEEWLARWEIERAEWHGYLRAQALRELVGAVGAPGEQADEAADGSVAPLPRSGPRIGGNGGAAPGASSLDAGRSGIPQRAIWTHAVCSGALERVRERLAGVVAAASALGAAIEPSPIGEAELEELQADFERFCDAAVSPRALEREVELRALDWTRYELSHIESPDEAVAREAAMCVREDGASLADVASLAGLALARSSVELDRLDEPLSSQLLGCSPGALLGPLQIDDGWRVVQVLERRAPSLSDPRVRDRAAHAAAAGAVAAEVVNRVRWHEHD